MATENEELIAFNAADADALLSMIGTAGQSISTTNRPPPRGLKWAMTKSTGLMANSKGNVFLRNPTSTGWTNGPEVEAWNEGAAIPANKRCLLISIDGRYCAFQVEC
jgi:hypothetical protein